MALFLLCKYGTHKSAVHNYGRLPCTARSGAETAQRPLYDLKQPMTAEANILSAAAAFAE